MSRNVFSEFVIIHTAVWSSGPGHSAWVDSKTKMTATSCSNSDNSKNIVVSLSEDDIPGAKLP